MIKRLFKNKIFLIVVIVLAVVLLIVVIKKSNILIPNANRGGMLVGETDKNGGRGITVLSPDGKIIMGGGEIIINEESSKAFCQELNRINMAKGGVEIPCEIENQANTTKT